MENEKILKALYAQRKLIIIQSYRMLKENSGFSESYVYSIAKDIFPIFHIDYYQDISIYNDFYKIKEDIIQSFITYIDDVWLRKEKIGFYDLEDKYGQGKRSELIKMLRYCYLDGRFYGDEFWNYLKKNGPIECNSINKDLDLGFDL